MPDPTRAVIVRAIAEREYLETTGILTDLFERRHEELTARGVDADAREALWRAFRRLPEEHPGARAERAYRAIQEASREIRQTGTTYNAEVSRMYPAFVDVEPPRDAENSIGRVRLLVAEWPPEPERSVFRRLTAAGFRQRGATPSSGYWPHFAATLTPERVTLAEEVATVVRTWWGGVKDQQRQEEG